LILAGKAIYNKICIILTAIKITAMQPEFEMLYSLIEL